MTPQEYLLSLTDDERNFIANLDYNRDIPKHRKELDLVINNGGSIKGIEQHWYPYEVIELGKNYLEPSHEREFTACAIIVLLNIISGEDACNDLDIGIDTIVDNLVNLKPVHKQLIEPLLDSVILNYKE